MNVENSAVILQLLAHDRPEFFFRARADFRSGWHANRFQRDLIRSVSATLREMGREELHEDTVSGYIGHGAPHLWRALAAGATEDECQRALKFFLRTTKITN